MKAVVLLSGGLDSAVTLALAQDWGYECHCLTFEYGQRHKVEIPAAWAIAWELKAASWRNIPLYGVFSGSALTGDSPIPTEPAPGIPPTYVPGRNTVFLAVGLSHAESIGADEVFIGVNAIDYSGYPDCRPEYIDAMNSVALLSSKAAVEGVPIQVRAPLVDRTKVEIVRMARRLGVPIDMTRSCYDPAPDGSPCHRCDSCRIRDEALAQA